MMPFYAITETGYSIFDGNGNLILLQDFDPRFEGRMPIPEEDRETLARAELHQIIMAMPKTGPALSISQEPIGPDVAKARMNGLDMRVVFTPGPDGSSLNGIRATVTASVMGHTLNGRDGFPSMDDVFGMPFQPLDFAGLPAGPAIIRSITFTAGVATVDFFPPQPCAYEVTEEIINSGLPAEKHLTLSTPIRIQGEIQ